MQKILIKLAQPGMVLARPVERGGITVAAAGLELTQALIERLGNMKIDRLVVEGNPVALEGGGPLFAARLERLDHLFRSYQADPWMRKVQAFLRHYFKLKATAEAALAAAPAAPAPGDGDEPPAAPAAAPAAPVAAPAAAPKKAPAPKSKPSKSKA